MDPEELAVAALVEQMQDPAPTEEPHAQQPEVNPQIPAVQDPAPVQLAEVQEQPVANPELVALMNGYQELQSSINGMKEQLTQNNQPELNEQDVAMKELKEKLGFTELETQNQTLVNQLNQMQQFIEQQQLQNEISQFKAERPNANEQAIAEYIGKLPENMQGAMDNPKGWKMIDDLLSSRSQPQTKPDPIVPSQTTQNTQPTDTFNKLKKDESVSDIDIGDALLSAAGFN